MKEKKSAASFDITAIFLLVMQVVVGGTQSSNIKPIAEPRGLPADVSAEARLIARDGDHSVSWLTIGEVQAYNWEATFLQTGNLDALAAARLFLNQDPKNWSVGKSGRLVGSLEMKRLLAANKITEAEIFSGSEHLPRETFPGLADLYLTAEWPRTVRSACSDFLAWLDVQNRVCRWHADRFPNDVRLVFSFDS